MILLSYPKLGHWKLDSVPSAFQKGKLRNRDSESYPLKRHFESEGRSKPVGSYEPEEPPDHIIFGKGQWKSADHSSPCLCLASQSWQRCWSPRMTNSCWVFALAESSSSDAAPAQWLKCLIRAVPAARPCNKSDVTNLRSFTVLMLVIASHKMLPSLQ